MSQKIIPVVFALDEGYIMPTTVAAYSLIDNCNKSYSVHIFLLVPMDFDEDKATELFYLRDKENVYGIDVIRVDSEPFKSRCHIEHITSPTYFRLMMGKLIPYDKCIYLDGDIIVLNDISLLYNIDVGENFIAGVCTPYFRSLGRQEKIRRANYLMIDSFDKYLNAGVLVFNLQAIREERMTEKFMSLLDYDFPVQDQDLLNSACFPRIKVIPSKFNTVKEIYRYSLKKLNQYYDLEEIKEAREQPVVFHFADKYKPWKYSGIIHENNWLLYYRHIYVMEPKRIHWKKQYYIDRSKLIIPKLRSLLKMKGY